MSGVLEKSRKGEGGGRFAAGLLAGAAAGGALLLLCAALLERGTLPAAVLRDCALGCLFFGAAAAGLRAAGKQGTGVLTAGVLAGGLLFLIVLFAAWLSPGGNPLGNEMLRNLICCLGGGLFGGALRLRRGKGKTHKRH